MTQLVHPIPRRASTPDLALMEQQHLPPLQPQRDGTPDLDDQHDQHEQQDATPPRGRCSVADVPHAPRKPKPFRTWQPHTQPHTQRELQFASAPRPPVYNPYHVYDPVVSGHGHGALCDYHAPVVRNPT